MSDRQKTTIPEGKIDPLFKMQWCEALRSGKYLQCRGLLFLGTREEMMYCCIGVGYAVKTNSSFGTNTQSASNVIGLPSYAISLLVAMNDDGNKSFSEIADWIEKNL